MANAKKQGYEDGYTECLAEGRRIASADMGEIECEAYDDGYSVGYEAGKTFGINWAESEHETKLPRIQEDADYARETILLCTIQKIDYVTNGTVRRVFACCQDMTCFEHNMETVVEHQFKYGTGCPRLCSKDERGDDTNCAKVYDREQADGEAQGFERGRNAGHSQGHQKGYTKGYARGFIVGHLQGNDDNWGSAYNEGYADANAEEDGRLDAAYKKGVDAAEETLKPRLASERQSGKNLGYNSGWDDGYEAHKSMRNRQEAEEAAEAFASTWDVGGSGETRDDGWGQADQSVGWEQLDEW
ncbi:hypothetical protein BKA58DRAFT_81054 [Alternaria rosae]|uniref:uncharacterized protein n=1 Tax=Alternaria rosae TaxID=1187941 RepID=UPI001E8EABD9|nr:uncharacterized protein BKA58DRAFT_81054 [Alternaria rosae]KAH6877706.1 hypothetical protein BKA58DRAFT_81054 [Alternaria rosae]